MELASRIKILPVVNPRAGLAVELKSNGRRFIVGAKTDLRMDMSRDSRRPRYTYDAGKVRYWREMIILK